MHLNKKEEILSEKYMSETPPLHIDPPVQDKKQYVSGGHKHPPEISQGRLSSTQKWVLLELPRQIWR